MEEVMPNQAEFYDEQAFAFNASKEYKKALNYYMKSLEIKEQIFGAEHEEIVIACRNIAVIYENLLQYSTALSFYERALQISHTLDLEDNQEIYILYSYIGNLYGELGEYDKSSEFLEEALARSIEDLGEHFETAKIYSYMADLYKNTKEYERALEMEESALWIYRDVLGDDDECTTECYQSLYRIYLYLKRWDKVDEITEKLLDIGIEYFGENSCEVFSLLNNLANSCFIAKEYTRALEIFHKILETEDVSPQNLMEVYNSMGRIYQELKDTQRTFRYFMKAYEMVENIQTENAAAICNNIATYFCDNKHYREALKLHEKCIEIREKIHGRNHPLTAHSFNNIAFTYSKMRNYQTAFKFYHIALRIRLDTLGELHDDTFVSLRNLAYTYGEAKQYEIALEFYQKILQISQKKHGKNHIETANALFNIGITNYNLKNHIGAVEYYEKALMLAKKLKDADLENKIIYYMTHFA